MQQLTKIVLFLYQVTVVVYAISAESCVIKVATSSSPLDSAIAGLQKARGSCYTIIINPGSYTIRSWYVLNNNTDVHILGNNSLGPVRVGFEISDEKPPVYFLLFQNLNAVEISGIEFEYSAGIIGFEEVSNVTITNSSFRWFSQGAIDIYQSPQVNVQNCIFENNGPVFILRNDQYRGHAAGLSIGYDENDSTSSSPIASGQVSVINCTFRNNTSDPSSNLNTYSYLEPNRPHEIFRGFILSGRGGGLAINVNSSFPFYVSIQDCLAENNKAQAFGGGVYLLFGAYASHHMEMKGTKIVNNECEVGGGLSLAALEGVHDGLNWTITDTIIGGNRAALGGGVFMHLGRISTSFDNPVIILRIQNGTFTRNLGSTSGAGLLVSSQLLHASIRTIPQIQFVDCEFQGNDGRSGGVLTSGYVPLIFEGRSAFTSNNGRVLVAIGSVIYIRGSVTFLKNSGGAFDGGAVYTTSFSNLKLELGANLSFVENEGVTGAGLVVSNMAALLLPEAYRYTQFNPLCVLQYSDKYASPSQWTNVSVKFSGNRASTGSAILMNGIDLCSFPNFGMLDRVFRWDFISFEENYNIAHGSSSANETWFVETLPKRIEVNINGNQVYPGERVKVNFRGIDELGRSTSSVIRLSSNDALFTPNVAVSRLISNATLTSEILLAGNHSIMSSINTNVSVESVFAEISSTDSFTMEINSCPIGFEEHVYERDGRHFLGCQCATINNPNIRDCDGRNVLIKEGLWAVGYPNQLTGGYHLGTFHCPLGYCRCFHSHRFPFQSCVSVFRIEEADIQCDCHREGILCGGCRNGTGFTTLLGDCTKCHSEHAITIVAWILVDIFVIGILLMLKTGPPSWSYPILLYAQVTPYLVKGFPNNFYPIQKYGHYFSNSLSLHLAYDFCIPRMDAHIAYLLRYVPFIITIVMATVVIVFRKLNKMSRIPWFGLWWVTLLQYSHIVHTSMTILNCPLLPDNDGNVTARWYVDANIRCFQDFHLILTIVAIFSLAFCISLIPLIFLYTFGRLQRPLLLLNSVLPTSLTYKLDVPYWSAMELLRRLILIFLTIISNYDYPLTMFLGLSLLVGTLVLPYKNVPVNYLDAVLTVNAFFLLIFRHFKLQESLTSTSEIESHFDFTCSSSKKAAKLEPISRRLVTFYYLPYIVAVLTVVIAVILALINKIKNHKNKLSREYELPHYSSSYRHSSDTTTYIMEDLPRDAVPLTTLYRHNQQLELSTSLLDSEVPSRYRVKVNHASQHSGSKFSRRKALTTVKQYKRYIKNSIRFQRSVHELENRAQKKRRKVAEHPPEQSNEASSEL